MNIIEITKSIKLIEFDDIVFDQNGHPIYLIIDGKHYYIVHEF